MTFLGCIWILFDLGAIALLVVAIKNLEDFSHPLLAIGSPSLLVALFSLNLVREFFINRKQSKKENG